MRHLRLLLALVAGIPTAATAQPLYELTPESGVPVSVDLDLLASDPNWVGLPTVEEGMIIAVQSSFEKTEDGYVWQGRTPGSEVDSVLLAGDEHGFFGTFGEYGSRRYEVSGSRAGLRVRPLVLSPAPEEYQCAVKTPSFDKEPESPTMDAHAASSVASASTTRTIDVLVLYTKNAYDYWDYWYMWQGVGLVGQDGMLSHTILYINQVFANNNVPARVRMVHYQRAPSIEPPPGYGRSDYWPEMLRDDKTTQDLRRQYEADIVLAFVHDSTAPCGHTWLKSMDVSDRQFAGLAGAMVNVYCDDRDWTRWWLTAVHEIGHLHGAMHDKPNAASNEPDPPDLPAYAHGYIDKGNRVRTPMAYGYSYDQVPYFSTTRLTPNGYTIGMAGEAENERMIQSQAASTAGFSRHIKLHSDAPDAPSGLTVTSPSVGNAYATWTDNADNETGFVVEYRLLGGSEARKKHRWKAWRLGLGFPNLREAWVQGLKSGKRYSFRVRAYNGEHMSLHSNKVQNVLID